MQRNGRSSPSIVWRPNIWRPSCGRRSSYDRKPIYDVLRSRQRRKGRDMGRARRIMNKRGKRTKRRTAMRGRRRMDKISTDPTRKPSETTTSPMGTRMLIGTPSRAAEVLRQTNGRSVEAMGMRTKSCLRRSRRRRWKRRKIYMMTHQRRRGEGGWTSC